ncbi:hypothetical protein DOTSEDRAFT_49733 [Dothistroma septosporum NZE10]|uniref:Amidohydrolase-related domain-containing protein n=1 Tax=Dothistroma septosporum (strain NZE10 / CBS 128990) TaxID=675120 RepID=N1Q2L0_DOTSN|nr:hypothetical protein DOTSEDRAFT_49733 [Dothistroma septosporum NZE10]
MASKRTHSTSNFSRLAARIPDGTWCAHMHVVDPITFPLDKSAQYTPSPHNLDQAKSFLGSLGITKMVIVQPSIYSNDNACTLDGLRQLGIDNGRAVVQFDPSATSHAQLQEWHSLGVRGVRLNLKSVGATPSAKALKQTMQVYGDAVRPFGWPLELYIALEDVPLLEAIGDGLVHTKVIVDHFAHPTAASLRGANSAYDIEGFQSLVRLLRKGNVWVKLSASYRLSKDPNDPVVESLCKEILRVRPDRCVFATDWPHTRFENVEIGAYLDKILDWIEEEGVSLSQVLVTNAEELFDARG